MIEVTSNKSMYANICRPVLKLDDYPDNPSTFGTSLKLLDNAKQICICHMGFRFDSYLGICSHLCSYCYGAGQNMRYGRHLVENFKVADLKEVKKKFYRALETNVSKLDKEGICIRQKYPIRLGTQTDCFQLAEKKYKITYKFINEIMNKYDYPYMICTKSKMVSDPEYLELYDQGKGNVAFQFTLTTLDQDYLNKIERGASTAKERLKAMQTLSKKGYKVICRMSPYIPEYMKDAEELIKVLADNGCTHIISELLRVSPILNKIMINECNYDVVALYKSKGVKMTGGYYRYPLKEKIEIQYKLRELCDKYNITFATCGDEDPTMHSTKMCCGLEGLDKFKSCPYATYDTMHRICKEKGHVNIQDILNHQYCANVTKFIEQWEIGYFDNVLKNVQYNKETNEYDWVECNLLLQKAYPSLIRES